MFDFNAMQQMFVNPYGNGIKKYMFEVLGNDYKNHEQIVEKITEYIKNPKDYQAFGNLIMAVYSKGHSAAVNQHKEILEKRGLKAKIIKP